MPAETMPQKPQKSAIFSARGTRGDRCFHIRGIARTRVRRKSDLASRRVPHCPKEGLKMADRHTLHHLPRRLPPPPPFLPAWPSSLPEASPWNHRDPGHPLVTEGDLAPVTVDPHHGRGDGSGAARQYRDNGDGGWDNRNTPSRHNANAMASLTAGDSSVPESRARPRARVNAMTERTTRH